MISDKLSWRWVFYIQGSACFVWLLLWIICVTNAPAGHPWISKEEIFYIEEGLENVAEKAKVPPVPWSHLFRSMPFLPIFVANFGNNWGFHLLMTEIPEYLKNMMNKDIGKNALLSSLPYACMWIYSLVLGYILDILRERKTLSTTIVRKIATFSGEFEEGYAIL